MKKRPFTHTAHCDSPISDERIVEEYIRLEKRKPNPTAATASVLSISNEQVQQAVTRSIKTGFYGKMRDKAKRLKR